MKPTQRLPLHRIVSRKKAAIGSGYPHPIFTGDHLFASNGVVACWEPVEDCTQDVPGPMPSALVKFIAEAPADAEVELRLPGGGAVLGLVFEDEVETERLQLGEVGMVPPESWPTPPERSRSKKAVRVSLSTAALHRLAVVLGAGGRDDAVELELQVGADGVCDQPIRVVVAGDAEGTKGVGVIAPWVAPSPASPQPEEAQ